MAKYRKKPVVIEAIQWLGTNIPELNNWLSSNEADRMCRFNTNGTLTIETLEGDHTAQINDFIIQGIQGEIYPCKPDIFAATYEAL